MKMIFMFKALSPENEKFERNYEISYDATMLDLHNLIVEDLKFDGSEVASFFTSDDSWSKLQEFTSENMRFEDDDFDMEELVPMYMGAVILGQIAQEKHQRLLYVFDLLGNRGLYLELIESFKDDGADFPRVGVSVGEAPIQIDEDTVGEEVSEMFDDMCDDEFGADEFDEGYYTSDEEYY